LLPLRRAVLAVFSTAVLLGLAWGCSASNDSGPVRNGSGGNTGIGEAGNDVQILSPESGEAGEGSLDLNPLCGHAPRCVPDQARECSSFVPPTLTSDAGVDSSVGSTSSPAGQSGEGGGAGQSSGGGAGGAAGASAESGAGGASAGAAGGPTEPSPEFSCQVVRSTDAPESVEAQCAVVGSGGVNAPCITSSDCGWDKNGGALGCIGDANAGLCEPYCCRGDDTCAVGSYCAERPLRDALTNDQGLGPDQTAVARLMIPVCVPAQNCDLSAPYPCPAGTQCACASGTACIVVRADGTTTCAVPGTGKAGDSCSPAAPCAWGHVCSVATNQCLKLCYTRGAETCGTGTCQASAELPDGWGVCVGSN
jgi:hypothetical protein